MIQQRVVDTRSGIQDPVTIRDYDTMHRRLSRKGWTVLDDILKQGIRFGHVLEIGPGPGYLGLDWLKQTNGTYLTGLDISEIMLNAARENAIRYFLKKRVRYELGDAGKMPFDDNCFDHIFSNGSLHEWENPVVVLDEAYRVLKPGGMLFVSDLRRDMNVMVKWFMKTVTKPKSMVPGLLTSISASYINFEAGELLRQSRFGKFKVVNNPMGITMLAKK